MTFQAIATAAAPQVDEARRVYHGRMMAQHLDLAMQHADRGAIVADLGEALCAALETVCAGMPDLPFPESSRAEAELWADSATPIELECYTAAALRRIARATFAPRARKRLFVALWESMDKAERRKFLSRVDPAGQFVRGVGDD